MLTFYVPPGIGDFSAMYSKLALVNRDITIRSSNDSPQRLTYFLDILTKVKNGGNCHHGASLTLGQTLPPGTDLASLPDGDYFLAINEWLEGGGKMKDWVPGDYIYHYMTPEFSNNQDGTIKASVFIDKIANGLPRVGVYCSAYGNSRHWGFWIFDKWKRFLELVHKTLPSKTQYLLLGAEYDLMISEVIHEWMKEEGMDSYLLLGAFHIGTTIEVIRRLDYFFVFPSGLGFLADVVNTPHVMWFPRNLDKMRGTFCDPENYEKKKTIHSLFSEPEVAALEFKTHGLKFLEERWQRSLKS